MSVVTAATGVGLAALAGLHVAWGAGSAFPARDRRELADLVAGSERVPGPPECFAVAGLLAAASALVVGNGRLAPSVRRAGVLTAGGVLGFRGLAGLTGRTSVLVPWEPSERFVALDRRYYGPLCLALAVGAISSLRT